MRHSFPVLPLAVAALASTFAVGSSEARTGETAAPILVPAVARDVAEHGQKSEARTAAARSVLERHCARCHDAAHVAPGSRPSGEFGNVLSLEEIARTPHLVRPGEPDASLLYQLMVARQMPPELRQPAPTSADASQPAGTVEPVSSVPDAADLAAIRDWISNLRPRAGACGTERAARPVEVRAALAQAAANLPADVASDMGFVSLAALHNRCAGESEIEAVRLALSRLLGRFAPDAAPVAVVAVAGQPLLLAFRLSHVGWSPGTWNRIVARVPASAREAAAPTADTAAPPAAWLAAVLGDPGTATSMLGVPPWPDKPVTPAAIGDTSPARLAVSPPPPDGNTRDQSKIAGLDAIDGLARRWTRDLDLVEAAAELGTDVAELTARLDEFESDADGIVARLRLGVVTRGEFEMLAATLSTGGATLAAERANAAATDGAAVPAAPLLRVDLWPTEASYRVGDRIVINVRASSPCHLTLVNVDSDDEATVLFPNEFDRDNLLKPGTTVTIPGPEATYRFRFDDAGTENFIAICEAGEPVPAGIRPEFTKQNFTPLGRWADFLRRAHLAALKPRVPLDYGDDLDRQFRRARRGQAAAAPVASPGGAPLQGRSAFRVEITP